MTDPKTADKILKMFLQKGDKIYRYFELAKELNNDRLDAVALSVNCQKSTITATEYANTTLDWER